jgi:hypothetical protein
MISAMVDVSEKRRNEENDPVSVMPAGHSGATEKMMLFVDQRYFSIRVFRIGEF